MQCGPGAGLFFAKGDYRNAWLSVRQALLVNSNNVQACRIMAELEDAVHSPATLDWCRRRAALSPATDNKLLLASVRLIVKSNHFGNPCASCNARFHHRNHARQKVVF
jgi:hypothetical protein